MTILGATGSIGASTLSVLARHRDRFHVHALTARRDVDTLARQCLEWRPEYAVMTEAPAAAELEARLKGAGLPTRVLAGAEALEAVAAEGCEVVMAAIVGAAGLLPTLAAARAGRRVLLANKEALVMSGALFMQAVRDGGAELLPIDSEHNAVFQCLPPQFTVGSRVGGGAAGVRRIILTASGGPFRTMPAEALAEVTPDQACAHPNWDMGRKISVDSATLMNKGLEVIEACWLFGATPETVDVVVHPQSVIHSLVEYVDGSFLAQLGNPDMRTPIAHALAWPERIDSGVARMDLTRLAALEFEVPDTTRFPCLSLAREAMHAGGTATAVLNAANEVAVAAFLDGEIGFADIPRIVEQTLARVPAQEADSLERVLQADAEARAVARSLIGVPRTAGRQA